MSINEHRNDDGFGRGLILIIIGVIALLITFFDFEIDWHLLSKMWPMILIIIGVCIMPINKWIKTAIALALLALGIMAYQHQSEGSTKIITIRKTEIINGSHHQDIWEEEDFDDD